MTAYSNNYELSSSADTFSKESNVQLLINENIGNNYQSIEKCKLQTYVKYVLDDHLQLQDSSCRKTTRVALEVIAMLIVTGARIGMTMICISGAAEILNVPISNPYALSLGITNAIGAIVAFGFLSAFSKLKIIEAITRFTAPIEESLMSDTTTCCKRTAIKAAALIIGFASQIPMGYAAYKTALFSPITVGLLTFLDGGRASYSTYMSLKALEYNQCQKKSYIEKKLALSRSIIMQKIAAFQGSLSTRENIPQEIDLHFFEDEILMANQQSQGKPLNRCIKIGVEVLVILMTAAVLAEFYGLGKAGGKALTHNKTFAILSGIFVAFSNTHLWYFMVRKVSFFAIDFFRGNLAFSLSESLMPRFYKYFTRVGSFLAIPTFVPSVLFAKLYFPKEAYYPIATLSSIAAILGGLASLHGLRDIIIGKCKNKEDVVVLHKKLERIKQTISQTNLQDIALFLIKFPNDIRKGFTDLEINELNNYINEL